LNLPYFFPLHHTKSALFSFFAVGFVVVVIA
jgi:hypothetical protein